MKIVQNLCAIAFAISFSTAALAYDSLAPHGSPTPGKMPITTPNRSIFLNGVDISSARNQDLRNVHVKITETGDIFISAPQYQVTEEETFMPLSSYASKSALPEHKPPQAQKENNSPVTARSAERAATESPKSAPIKNDSPAPAQPASNTTPRTGG
jgi:outer membrane biosynthesis protein TonB